MRIYIISLMVSIVFFTGCENIDFDFSNDKNDTVIVTPIPPIDDNETDSNETVDNNETDSNETVDDNETDSNETVDNNETQIIDKRESIETIAKEWYVRIVVEDTTNDMKTASTQLGQLETEDVVTKHTLTALAPFSPTFLDVVFVNPMGVDAGSYKTNFHTSGTDADSWEFTVKSHDENADMILGWRGLYVLSAYVDSENRARYHEYRSMTNLLLPYMTLLDIATNTEIDVLANGTVNEYVFNMNGATERTFKWKVKDTSLVTLPSIRSFSKVVGPTQTQKLKTLQIQALRKDAKAKPDALKKKRLNSFDMTTPPTFEVLVK